MDFHQAEAEYKRLKTRFRAGELTEAQFKAALRDLMVQDERGDWWLIGHRTERWHRHDGDQWVEANPPGSLREQGQPVPPPEILAENTLIYPKKALRPARKLETAG